MSSSKEKSNSAADDTVYPTHTCFSDCIVFLNSLAENGAPKSELEKFTIVHALIRPYGEVLAHGWLERDESAFFGGIIRGEKVVCECSRQEYRDGCVIVKETRYTVEQAVINHKHTDSDGPWEPEYRQHCKKD